MTKVIIKLINILRSEPLILINITLEKYTKVNVIYDAQGISVIYLYLNETFHYDLLPASDSQIS